MFDFIFNKIETNMREIGYGDVTVNKNMKFLVKEFYNILLNCENYKKKDIKSKNQFFLKFLSFIKGQKNTINTQLIEYFDKYETFCFELNSDSVLEGELNFKYK